jgi:hypothetical protein
MQVRVRFLWALNSQEFGTKTPRIEPCTRADLKKIVVIVEQEPLCRLLGSATIRKPVLHGADEESLQINVAARGRACRKVPCSSPLFNSERSELPILKARNSKPSEIREVNGDCCLLVAPRDFLHGLV